MSIVQTYFNIYCVHIKNRVSVSREFGFTFATLCVDCLKTCMPTHKTQLRRSSFRRNVDFDSPVFGGDWISTVRFTRTWIVAVHVTRKWILAVRFHVSQSSFKLSKSTFKCQNPLLRRTHTHRNHHPTQKWTAAVHVQLSKSSFKVSKSTLRGVEIHFHLKVDFASPFLQLGVRILTFRLSTIDIGIVKL